MEISFCLDFPILWDVIILNKIIDYNIKKWIILHQKKQFFTKK